MRIFIFVFSTLFAFSLSAQDYDRIANAFATGNAGDVSRMCSERIDYSTEGKERSISKSETEINLKAFFKSNEPNGFKTVHKGVSQSDVRYIIAELNTRNGKYRVTIYLRKSGEEYLIQSLEIEKQ